MQLEFVINRAYCVDNAMGEDTDLEDLETAEEIHKFIDSDAFKHLRIFPVFASTGTSGITSGRDALLVASEFGQIESIERLVTTWKEDVNGYDEAHGEVRRSSLMVALMYPKMNRTIELLCELGADVDVPMAQMYSPIFEAISGGNADGINRYTAW
eukprot:jgi/Picsp_1/4945/NSC_02309-R1_---NA---